MVATAAAIAGGLGALAGGAGGLIGGLKGGGGGGGGAVASATNPAFQGLGNLLGSEIVVGKRGAFTIPTHTSIFGSNFEDLRRALTSLFDPGPLNIPEQLAFGIEGVLGDTLNPVQQLFTKQLLPSLRALASGKITPAFRTDLSPVINQAKERFSQDFLPALAERVSPTFSEFGTIAGREGQRIATDLGTLDVQLNNPAQILANLTSAGSLGAGIAALPLNLIADLLGTGDSLRQRGELGPRRIFETFQTLAGIPTQSNLTTFQPRSSAENFLTSAQGINQITAALNNVRDFSSGISFGDSSLAGIPPALRGGTTIGSGTSSDPFRLAGR